MTEAGIRVDVLTLFPEAFSGPLDVSIIRRAREAGLLDLAIHDIREAATDRHRSVDDYPFGGGQGMVMRPDVLDRAIEQARAADERPAHVVYLTPQGERLSDRLVRELATYPRLILICGRYEGIDHRVIDHCVDREVSIGDYVLTGGELPAMVLIDAVARHVPGALGDEASAAEESFADGLLEHPQYTRPASYRGWDVPPVLLSGDHAAIERWRDEQRRVRTARRRPDMVASEPAGDPPTRKVAGARLRTYHAPTDARAVERLLAEAGLKREDFERLVAHDPGLALVAEVRKRVVGVMMAGSDGLVGTVYGLALGGEPDGDVAAALLEDVAARLRLRGCARAECVARDSLLTTTARALGWHEPAGGRHTLTLA